MDDDVVAPLAVRQESVCAHGRSDIRYLPLNRYRFHLPFCTAICTLESLVHLDPIFDGHQQMPNSSRETPLRETSHHRELIKVGTTENQWRVFDVEMFGRRRGYDYVILPSKKLSRPLHWFVFKDEVP